MGKSSSTGYQPNLRPKKAITPGPEDLGSLWPLTVPGELPFWVRENLASAGHDPKRFTVILRSWLSSLGVAVPNGVFRLTPKGKGRPRDDSAFGIWLVYCWEKDANPGLSGGEFAKKVDPEGFAKHPKRTADRLMKRVQAYQRYMDTESGAVRTPRK